MEEGEELGEGEEWEQVGWNNKSMVTRQVGREGEGEEAEPDRGGVEGGWVMRFFHWQLPNVPPCLLQTSYRESPISQVFGGELLSIVQKQGSKESATVEPFFALPLDIQVSVVGFEVAGWLVGG